MTLYVFLLIVQSLLAASLAISCFCRLRMTDGETHREIRWAIWFQGVCAGLLLGAPVLPMLIPELHGTVGMRWLPGFTPDWVFVLQFYAATLMQLSTARFWRYGTPSDFQTRGFT